MSAKLYQEVVDAASDCLGPTAERLLSRLIRTHLQKQPEELNVEDIPELLGWAKLIMGLYTDKQSVITRFTDHIEALPNKSQEDS